MPHEKVNTLLDETLITLKEAAEDFAGVKIPLNTVQKYVYQGVKGLKLESISINGRYTSKEAIRRFIEQKQELQQPPKIKRKSLTQTQTDAILKRYKIIK
jgi:flagellar biosynthesis component FlhA